MRSFTTILRLVAQALLAALAVDSIVTHFNPRYTDFSNHDRIQDELANLAYGCDAQGGSPTKYTSRDGGASPSSRADGAYTVTSWSNADKETAHYTLERSYTNQTVVPSDSVLFLTITRDEKSWGRNPDEQPRTIYSFLDFITNTTLTPSATSLAILTSSQHEFEQYKQVLTPSQENKDLKVYYDYPFQRITLVLHTAPTRAPIVDTTEQNPSTNKATLNTSSSRKDRHAIAQHERRATLAKLRNYLQSVSLSQESHLLWLDSDVYKFSSRAMVAHMMSRTTTTLGHEIGILTARCRMGEPEKTDAWLSQHPEYIIPPPPSHADEPEDARRGVEGGPYEVIAHKLHANGHYDLNAWRGRRTRPNDDQQEALWHDLSSWEPHPAPDGATQMLDQAIAGTADDEVVRLDSVGGTVLMMRADLVRMGLNFATGYFVGMTFEHGEGFDGIETEGVCLLSRSLSRDGASMCYSLGGSWR